MLDRTLIGKKYPIVEFKVSAQRLKFFSKVTGQTDPIYFDHEYAKKKNYKGVVCPPTFLIAAVMEQDNFYKYLQDINVAIKSLLHAEQEFIYNELIYEGDSLKIETMIEDMFDKKEGLLQFCTFKSKFTNQDNVHVATARFTILVR